MREFKFPCPACGKRIEAPVVMLGERVECPHCAMPIQVPNRPTSPSSTTVVRSKAALRREVEAMGTDGEAAAQEAELAVDLATPMQVHARQGAGTQLGSPAPVVPADDAPPEDPSPVAVGGQGVLVLQLLGLLVLQMIVLLAFISM